MKSKKSNESGSLVTWAIDYDLSLELKLKRNPSLEVGIVLESGFRDGDHFYSVFWAGLNLAKSGWVRSDSIRKYGCQ